MMTNKPAYSIGKVEEGHKAALIKIDEGRFENSVFSYENLQILPVEGNPDVRDVKYDLQVECLFIDGIEQTQEVEGTPEIVEFYNTVSNPILYDLMTIMARGDELEQHASTKEITLN